MKRLYRLFILALGMVLAANSVQAQQSVELIMDNFTSSVLSQTNTMLANSAVESSMRNARKGRGNMTAKAGKINLSYTPTRELQQRTVQNLGKKLSAQNAAAGQAFNNALGPGKADYNQLFAQMVQVSGLPANNAATALAAYLELGYIVVNNVQDNHSITPEMDRALQRQATALLSQNSKLSSPTVTAQLGEELKLQSVVLYLGWQSVMKSGQTGQFRNSISQQFRSKGLDLSRLSLTTKGLMKR